MESGHPDPGSHDATGLIVGNGWVGKDVEDLVEEPATFGFAACLVDEALVKFVAGPRVSAGQCLIEQLHEFVENLDVGLGQRGQQNRMAPFDIGALQRLVG